MIQGPNQVPVPETDEKAKPRFSTSIVTNTLAIILFFFSFCQIKGCSSNYTPVSGFRLSFAALMGIFDLSPLAIIFGTVLITLLMSVLALVFCFSNPQKMEKRSGICAMIGLGNISVFIFLCLSDKGVIIEWPPFAVAILHLINIIYYTFKWPRIKEPPA